MNKMTHLPKLWILQGPNQYFQPRTIIFLLFFSGFFVNGEINNFIFINFFKSLHRLILHI